MNHLNSPGARKREIQRNLRGYGFISPWLVGFAVFSLVPLAFSLGISFCKWGLLDAPKFVGLRNYVQMFTQDSLFWQSLKVTLLYSLVSVPLNLVFSLLVALLLNQKIVGIGFFRTAFYLPSVVSGVAVAVLWMWVLQPNFGIINYFLSFLGIRGPDWLGDPRWSLWALILMSTWGIGGNMVINLAGLQNIPQYLYEAASIDGAGAWTKFWRITLPMLSPTLFFNLVMGIIGSLRTFTQGYVMTGGGPLNSTLFYALYLYNQAFKNLQMGYASALAWVLFVIILLLTLVVFKTSDKWVYYEAGGDGR